MVLVREVMTKDPISVPETAAIDVAIDMMVEKNISGVPLVDEKGALAGLITEYDVLQLYDEQCERSVDQIECCRDFMSTDVRTIDQDASLEVAANIFRLATLRRLLVVDGPWLVGILSRRDVVRCIRDGRLVCAQ